jgi:hypothetical protein
MVRQRVQEYREVERGRPPPVKPPSPRRASWLLLGGGWEVTAEEAANLSGSWAPLLRIVSHAVSA